MSVANVLCAAARELAAASRERLPRLQSECTRLQTQLIENENEMKTARFALQRAADYEPTFGTNYICPACWIKEPARVLLTPIEGDPRVDRFRCHGCGAVFDIPF